VNSHLLSLAATALAGCGAWRLRGTTLAAPAVWAAGSLAAVGCVELLAATGLVDGHPASQLRFAAAVTVLCPMMAVLGAKRPQDRAWQWVVVALLATLWLPAANVWIVGPSEAVHLSLAWQAFIAVLWLLGPLNYLPTGNWLPALLASAGQGVVLAPFLAPAGWSLGEKSVPAALAAIIAAMGIVWVRSWRRSRLDARSGGQQLDDLNATWLRFRDAFGAFWAVRVMQRVNLGVESMEPPFTLAWHGWEGFPDVHAAPCDSDRKAILHAAKTQRTALRRFVVTQT
jgi:hypothetical protein